MFVQVRAYFCDSDAGAAEADFGLVVSVWSAGCLRTWTVCQVCGRTPADARDNPGAMTPSRSQLSADDAARARAPTARHELAMPRQVDPSGG